MKFWMKMPRIVFPLLAAATAADLSAADKIDLDRVMPVAANEPVPVMDFVRPRILRSPTLNLAGTHIAAIISPSIDHTELMVYDLRTQKVERFGAKGDSDVYGVDWLNSQLLIYEITVQKRGIIGLYAGDAGALSASYPLVQWVGSYLIAVPPQDRAHPLVSLAATSLNTG